MDRKVLVTETHLEAIADAIREKLGTEQTYKPPDMAAAIESIEHSTPRLIPLTATTNGVYDPGGTIDGYSGATVAVPTFTASVTDRAIVLDGATVTPDSIIISGPRFIHKLIAGDGNFSPQDDGADAYSSVTVAGAGNVGEKLINANGVYNAVEDSLAGYNKVIVSIPDAGLKWSATAARLPNVSVYRVRSIFDMPSVLRYGSSVESVPPPITDVSVVFALDDLEFVAEVETPSAEVVRPTTMLNIDNAFAFTADAQEVAE